MNAKTPKVFNFGCSPHHPTRINPLTLLWLLSLYSQIAQTHALSYVSYDWKYTTCVTHCNYAECPAGYKHMSGWCHWSWDCVDSNGYQHSTCGWAWQERCKCFKCAAGYFGTNSGCQACPAGKISNKGASSCTDCSSGTYTDGEPRTLCLSCEPGRYNPSSTDDCTACPKGSYSTEWKSTSCIDCEKGKFSDEVGSNHNSCKNCPADKYADGTGRGKCDACPSGKTSESGASNVNDCKDINECASSSSNNCDNVCSNTEGSYTCSCLPSFLSSNGGSTCDPNSIVGGSFSSYEARVASRNTERCPDCWDVKNVPMVQINFPPDLATSDVHSVTLSSNLIDDNGDHKTTSQISSNVALDSYVTECNADVGTPDGDWNCEVSYSSTYGDRASKNSPSSFIIPGEVNKNPLPCACRPGVDNGAPLDFQITQVVTNSADDVYFKFTWRDGSLCEEKFVFSRIEASGTSINIGQFDSLSATSDPQCGSFYDSELDGPRDTIDDDAPGSIKRYCIKSIGYDYTGPSVCESIAVKWMSKISGYVRTPTGRGVVGVSFRWYFKDYPTVEGTIDSATNTDGSFSFPIIHDSLTDSNAKIMICPSKHSTGIDHEFKYNTLDLPIGGCGQINANHLGYQPMDFTDTSVFMVSGQILFPPSEHIHVSSPCGSVGIEVCANPDSDQIPPPPPVCEVTDADGNYAIALPTGSSFNLTPKLNNHTFASSSDGAPTISVISLTESITGQDFTDTTTVKMTASLHGGRCKKFLGDFKVRVQSVNSCYSQEVWHRSTQLTELDLELPALDFDVTLLQVESVEGVSGDHILTTMESRLLTTQRVELHEITHNVGFVAYEYNPQPIMVEDSTAKVRGSCTEYQVVESWRSYNATFDVYQSFGSSGECHDVVGMWWVLDNTREGADCSLDFCNPPMEHEVRLMDGQNYTTRSFINFPFIAGAANPSDDGDYPHQKTLVVKFAFDEDSSRVETVMPFFIEGEKLLGSSFSMDFPQTLPIMIIHDPPGGGSSAFFEKDTKVTTSISMSSDYEVGGSASTFIKGGYEQKEEVCVGVGVSKCNDVLTTTATKYGSLSVTTVGGETISDGWSFTLSDQTKYTTSSYAGITGRDADTVLTMAINIKFGLSKEVTFDKETCSGSTRDSVQWMPKSPDSGEVIVYKTIYDIEQVMLPSLRRSLEAERGEENPSNATIFQLKSAINGWEQVIAYNDEIHANATKAAEVGVNADSENPSDLQLDDVGGEGGVEGAKRISWSGGGQAYSFESETSSSASHTFSHDVLVNTEIGGGMAWGTSLLGFQMLTEFSASAHFKFHVGESRTRTEAEDIKTGFTLSDSELGDYFVTEVLTDPVYGTPLFRTLSGASRCIWEPGTVPREQIEMSFADGGKHLELTNVRPDEAVPVEISLCNFGPDESTFDYKLSVVHKTNPFSLEILNMNEPITQPIGYIIPHGCIGAVLEVQKGPLAYSYDKVMLRMSVPCESSFWNGNGMARMYDTSDMTISIDFLRPCPRVIFAGATEIDGVFVYSTISDLTETIRVVVRNDEYREVSWKDSERLEGIKLQYRKSYSNEEVQKKEPWVNADVGFQLSDGSQVDFKEHDEYGFMNLMWDVSKLVDDYYEIRVVSLCTESGPDTADLDISSTRVMAGVIDRTGPRVMGGFSEPTDHEWELGDDISVITSENIDWGRGYTVTGSTVDEDILIENDELDTLAAGRSLLIAFGARLNVGKFMGRTLQLTLDNFYDFAGNKNEKEFSWSFTVKEQLATDVSSLVDGLLLRETGAACVLNRNSGSCKGFDALLVAEISTLLEVSTGRIKDTVYEEVTIPAYNGTASFVCTQVGFRITPAKVISDTPAWILSSRLVDGLEDEEGLKQYTALSEIYFRKAQGHTVQDPSNPSNPSDDSSDSSNPSNPSTTLDPFGDGSTSGGWTGSSGGITTKMHIKLNDEQSDKLDSMLSKKHLFVAGVCICVSMTIVASLYIMYSRTQHKKHKRQHEVEELEAELEAQAQETGYVENVDIEHMSPSEIRKMTAVRRITRGKSHHKKTRFNVSDRDSMAFGVENPMHSNSMPKQIDPPQQEKVDEGVIGWIKKKSKSIYFAEQPRESADAHHNKELQMQNIYKGSFGGKQLHDTHHNHKSLQERARQRKSVHTHKHLKSSPLPPGALPESVDQFFTEDGISYFYHEESGKVGWTIQEIKKIIKEHEEQDGSHCWKMAEKEEEDDTGRMSLQSNGENSHLPEGVQRYFTEAGVEYFYCIKSGKTVWQKEDIVKGVDI